MTDMRSTSSAPFADRELPFVRKVVGLLHSRSVRLLSGRWLLERPEGYVIQRCQDLEPRAFVAPIKAAQLYQSKYGIVVLSYPWLSKRHPDPTGFFFRLLQQYLAKHMQQFCDFNDGDVGIFWDFAALPQPCQDGGRSEAEKKALKRGLQAINFLYGSPDSVVLQFRTFPDSPDLDLNLRPYKERGWCVFEETISNILKPSLLLLDLGVPAALQALEKDTTTWWDIQRATKRSKRAPVLHPDAMKTVLDGCVFTKGNVDRPLVEEKYREFFDQIADVATLMHFSNFGAEVSDGWGDQCMQQVSRALPTFINIRHLNIFRQPFSDQGLRLIVEPLPHLEHLCSLSFYGCNGFQGTGFDAFAGREMQTLKDFCLNRTSINDVGMAALAPQLPCFRSLEVLNIRNCRNVGTPGFQILARHLPAELAELHFGQSAIDDNGLFALIEVLPGLKRMRKLDFHVCEALGPEGLAALSRCLPQLPRMATAQESFRCSEGHSLHAGDVDCGDYTFCSDCHERFLFGTTRYFCSTCLGYGLCRFCAQGALLLPGHLCLSPESLTLRSAWTDGGREPSQLRWS